MKLIVVSVHALLSVVSASVIPSSFKDYYENLDYSKVIPVHDMPGFWDGREIRPAMYPAGDKNRTGRIVGGEIVTPHSHPYQVGLLPLFDGVPGLCGGSIITRGAVVTVAHCISNSQLTEVVAGAHQLTANEPTQYRVYVAPSDYNIHDSFNPSNLSNNIAMLVNFDLILNAQIAVIPLAVTNSPTFVGQLATVSGWGRFSDDSQATSAELRSVQNNVISNALCAETFPHLVVATTMCLSTAGGQGTCFGDSGSPITIPFAGGRLLIGISAFGSGDGCELGHPTGAERVSSHYEWISMNQT